MKNSILSLLALSLMGLLAACTTAATPTLEGADLTIRNTIQSVAFNFPDETDFGNEVTKTLGSGTTDFGSSETEFVYDITVSDSQITMTWVDIPANEAFERVIEDGTFDRYYFTFDSDVIDSISLNSASTLGAEVTSSTGSAITIEVGPGDEVGPGFDATFDLTLK